MLLLVAKSDGRLLRWGQRPFATEPDPVTVNEVQWDQALPAPEKDYRLVNGALVLDPLPNEWALARERLRTRYQTVKERLDAIADDPAATDINAEVRQGLRDVADYLRDTLRYLKAGAG